MNIFKKDISQMMKKESKVPNWVKDCIYDIDLTKKNKITSISSKFSNAKRAIAASILIGTLSTGIVFAEEIQTNINNLFGISDGISSASENGYIEDLSKDSTSQIHMRNTFENINFTTTNFILDNSTLNITINVEFENEIDANIFKTVNFDHLAIFDENNILYTTDNYLLTANTFLPGILPTDSEESSRKYLLNTNYSGTIKNLTSSGFDIVINVNSMYDSFPKSEKLYIGFLDLILYDSNKSESTKSIITGEYLSEIIVPEQFNTRSLDTYNVSYTSNNNLEITNLLLTSQETSTIVNISAKKHTHFLNTYLKDEYGNVYNCIETSLEYSENSTNYFIHYDLSKYDATDKLELVFEFENNSTSVITLEK